MSREPVDLAAKLAAFSELWSPKVVARLNDYEVHALLLEPRGVVNTGSAAAP